MCLDTLQFRPYRALGMPEIVRLLQAQPDLRSVAAKLADPKGHLAGDAGATGQHLVQHPTTDPKLLGGLADTESQRRKNIIPQDLPGMGRRCLFVTLGIPGHRLDRLSRDWKVTRSRRKQARALAAARPPRNDAGA